MVRAWTLCSTTDFKLCAVKDLLSKTKIKLVDILDMDEHTVDELLNVVYQSCCPEPKTEASMRSKTSSLGPMDSYLPTQIPDLDTSLRGGLLMIGVPTLYSLYPMGPDQI